MNQPEMEYWVMRLDRLEQENRLLKILGSLVVLVLSVFLLTGATNIDPSKIIEVIRARQITLVDKDGTARAGMGILPDGTVTIGLLDKNGTLRTGLRLSDKGSLSPSPSLERTWRESSLPKVVYLPESLAAAVLKCG